MCVASPFVVGGWSTAALQYAMATSQLDILKLYNYIIIIIMENIIYTHLLH